MGDSTDDLSGLIACHECDLLHRSVSLSEGATASCSRCGAVLQRRPKDALDASLALAIASLVLFVLANAYPF